jgi:hypothetical protein
MDIVDERAVRLLLVCAAPLAPALHFGKAVNVSAVADALCFGQSR